MSAVPAATDVRGLSDERLVALAAAGDPCAMAAIYERYRQAVWRYCRSILRDDHDAADAVQNTMVSLMRSLTCGREVPLRPWLFRIAHNEAVSLLRTRRAHASIDDAAIIERLGVPARGEDVLAARETLGDVARLAPRQRSALLLRELVGLSYEEIGHALDSRPATVRQAVHKARRALTELAAGRERPCPEIRATLRRGDGRMLAGWAIRGHLAECADCRAFAASVRARRRLGVIPAPALLALERVWTALTRGGRPMTQLGAGMHAGVARAGELFAVGAVTAGVAGAAALPAPTATARAAPPPAAIAACPAAPGGEAPSRPAARPADSPLAAPAPAPPAVATAAAPEPPAASSAPDASTTGEPVASSATAGDPPAVPGDESLPADTPDPQTSTEPDGAPSAADPTPVEGGDPAGGAVP